MSPAKIADSRRSTRSFAKLASAAEASPYQLAVAEAMSEFSHRRRQTSGTASDRSEQARVPLGQNANNSQRANVVRFPRNREIPPEVVNALSGALHEAVQSKEMIEALAKVGNEPTVQTPGAFATTVKADIERWAAVVKERGFVAED
jgi:hypothetical protein